MKIESLLKSGIILAPLHPRSLISIHLQPFKGSFGANNEPRLFAIAFNGAIAALLDAAIPLRSVPVAVTDGTSTVVFEYHTQLTCKEMSDEFDQSPLEETSSTLLFSELFGPDSAETLRILEKESQDMFNNLKNALETACVDN